MYFMYEAGAAITFIAAFFLHKKKNNRGPLVGGNLPFVWEY